MILDIELKGDRDSYHRDSRVNEIVDLLLDDESILFKEIINLINGTNNYGIFQSRVESLTTLICSDSEYISLHDLLLNYISKLFAIYKDKKCSNLRGALLERFVYKLIEIKCGSRSDLSISCFVHIDGMRSTKSVDILHYSNVKNEGEIFECKINPDHIGEDHINNLFDIFIRSNEIILPNIASFQHKEALELKIKELNSLHKPIKLFGLDNLKEISNFSN
ncbi:MAG TPA: hypothetical protein C5S51_01200 [Methanosarcinaceae archaeon]|nr:hypothetical protein [Methanosarcinaceae archaeon]